MLATPLKYRHWINAPPISSTLLQRDFFFVFSLASTITWRDGQRATLHPRWCNKSPLSKWIFADFRRFVIEYGEWSRCTYFYGLWAWNAFHCAIWFSSDLLLSCSCITHMEQPSPVYGERMTFVPNKNIGARYIVIRITAGCCGDKIWTRGTGRYGRCILLLLLLGDNRRNIRSRNTKATINVWAWAFIIILYTFLSNACNAHSWMALFISSTAFSFQLA